MSFIFFCFYNWELRPYNFVFNSLTTNLNLIVTVKSQNNNNNNEPNKRKYLIRRGTFYYSYYYLLLQATEIGSKITPAPSVTTEVTIIITDVNDQEPKFRNNRYECEIVENAPINTPLTFLGNSIPQVADYDLVSFLHNSLVIYEECFFNYY